MDRRLHGGGAEESGPAWFVLYTSALLTENLLSITCIMWK
jgi:hypothetical protein